MLVAFFARCIFLHAVAGSKAYNVTTISTRGIRPYHITMHQTGEHAFVIDTSSAAIYLVSLSADIPPELFAGQPGMHGWTDGHRIDPPGALLHSPTSLCLHPSSGDIYFLDRGPTQGPSSTMITLLRMIDVKTGAVRTIAGSVNDSGTSDGIGSDAVFSMGTSSIQCSPHGALFLADRSGTGSIRRVDCVGEDCIHPQPHPDDKGWVLLCWFLWKFAWISGVFISGMFFATILIASEQVREAIQRFRERSSCKGENLISLIDE